MGSEMCIRDRYEYSGERFNTGITSIDNIENLNAPSTQLYVESVSGNYVIDETVYVWGKENLEYLNALRYDTIYMVDTSGSFELKLQTLDSAYKQFGEILFLDWDCKTELPLDAIKELRLPSPSMPLYSYPSDYHPHWDMVEACSWELDNIRVLPNACFIYTKDRNIGKELLDIVEELSLIHI